MTHESFTYTYTGLYKRISNQRITLLLSYLGPLSSFFCKGGIVSYTHTFSTLRVEKVMLQYPFDETMTSREFQLLCVFTNVQYVTRKRKSQADSDYIEVAHRNATLRSFDSLTNYSAIYQCALNLHIVGAPFEGLWGSRLLRLSKIHSFDLGNLLGRGRVCVDEHQNANRVGVLVHGCVARGSFRGEGDKLYLGGDHSSWVGESKKRRLSFLLGWLYFFLMLRTHLLNKTHILLN